MAHRHLRGGMTPAEATAVLGVAADADADQVRRAWRAWARLAHPDRGGDREFFDRLRTARDVLIASAHTPRVDIAAKRSQEPPAPPARATWSQVARRPGPREIVILAGGAIATSALAAIVALVGQPPQPMALAVAAGPAAVAAAGWAHVAVSRMLTDRADVAHRITALTAAWVPGVAAQVFVAEIAGASLVRVLPVLALPFVAVVTGVNPGAGLWSPRGSR